MTLISRTIEARFDQIAILDEMVEQGTEEAGFDPRQCYAVKLAVCEALENIIVHGYQGESGNLIEAHIEVEPSLIRIKLWDDAPPFNPADQPQERTWSKDDPPVGGLGLKIIHKVMDEIRHERRGNRNLLCLVKRSVHSEVD